MQCDRAQELYSDYIEDTLTPALKQVLEQHMASCQSCRQDVAALRDVFFVFEAGTPEFDPPHGFRASVLTAIREQPQQRSLTNWVRMWLLPSQLGSQSRYATFGTVAGIAVLMIVGVILQSKQHDHKLVYSVGASFAPVNPVAGSQPENPHIVQFVHNTMQGGNTAPVIGLNSGSSHSPVSSSAYLIYSSDSLINPSAVSDDKDLSPKIWSGTLSPSAITQLTINIVQPIPSGTSMTVLVKPDGQSDSMAQTCIMPLNRFSPGQRPVVSTGEPLYQALQTISVYYHTPLIFDRSAMSKIQTPIHNGLGDEDTSLEPTLANLIRPSGLTFQKRNDGSYLIDGNDIQ